jgi:GPH family glycoside/pentoside/hexuronide:cation symporter
MNDPSTAEKPYTAPNREIYGWAIGGIATHALICMYGQAMNIFTVGFGLQASIVGWAMMLPRVFDAIIDPMMGHFSDNLHTRWGRRKPFLVAGSVLAALFVVLLWWGNREWSNTAQLIYLTVLGTLFYCSWGLYSMAWNSLGYELTDDYNHRSRVAAIGGLFASGVLALNGWTYWFALRPFFGGEVYGIRWISGGVAVIAIAAAFYAASNCKERFAKVNKEHTPIGPALKTTLKNRPFVILLAYKFCQILGERVFTGLLFFLGMYYVCKGDKTLATGISGLGGTIGSFLGFVVLPFIPLLSRTLGKRAGLTIPAGVAFAMALSLPLILTPAVPYLLLLPTLLLMVLSIIANTMTNAILPDICDLDELDNGERREGLYTAVVAFVSKLEISLTVLVVGYLVDLSGFNPKLPTQPDAVMNRMLWMAIIPTAFFTLGGLILAMRFRMNEASMDIIRAKLEERRAARKLAEGL